MRPGIGSYAYRWSVSQKAPGSDKMDIRAFIEEATGMGANAVQICDNLPVERLTGLELESLKKDLSGRQIYLELGMRGNKPEKIREMISICSVLDVPVLRIVLGGAPGTLSIGDYTNLLAAPLKEAEHAGVTLAVENHFELSPFQLAELIRKTGSPYLRVCLDVVNSVKFLSGYRETCRVLAPLAATVHIKDVEVNRFDKIVEASGKKHLPADFRGSLAENFPTGFYVSGCPLGEGVLDLAWVIREIGQHGPDPAIFVESWMDPLATMEETVAEERKMVSRDFNRLKQYSDE